MRFLNKLKKIYILFSNKNHSRLLYRFIINREKDY